MVVPITSRDRITTSRMFFRKNMKRQNHSFAFMLAVAAFVGLVTAKPAAELRIPLSPPTSTRTCMGHAFPHAPASPAGMILHDAGRAFQSQTSSQRRVGASCLSRGQGHEDRSVLLRDGRPRRSTLDLLHGQWVELTTASFSHDPTGKTARCAGRGADRLDRFMGVENGQFFLSHGGFVPGFTKYGEKFTRPALGEAPSGFVLPETSPRMGSRSQADMVTVYSMRTRVAQ